MNRIIASILVVAFLGMLVFSLGCGKDGYEPGSSDPSTGPAQEAAGVEEKAPVDTPSTIEGATQAPEDGELPEVD